MNYGKKKALSAVSVGRINLMSQSLTGTQPALDRETSIAEDGEDSDKESVKRKSRNMSEKKRRDQFNLLVNELCSMVSSNNRKMDKTSVLKSTISFLRSHNDMAEKSHAHDIREDWKPSFLSNDEFAQLMLEALDGFLLVVTQGGTILYTSESVTSLLNHLPSDLVNQSIYNFTHADERMKIYQLLSQHRVVHGNSIPDYKKEKSTLEFTCHLKCGTTLPDEPCVYELVECTGNFRHWSSDGALIDDDLDMAELTGRSTEEICFCCTVKLKRSQLIRELSVVDDSKKEFTSRMSMEWSFLFLDHRGPPVIGYLPFEVLGTSGYDYYHPDDLEKIRQSHEQLMQTGEGTSCYYRFLTKGQQWIWLQTRFFITYHQWNSKPEFIVCTNTVVSYAEVRNNLREHHVAQNLNAGSKIDVSSPSNPDTTNISSSMRVIGNHTLPSPSPSRRSVTASEMSDGVDTTESTRIPKTPSQHTSNLVYLRQGQSCTQDLTEKIQSPGASSVISGPRSVLSTETVVTSQALVKRPQNGVMPSSPLQSSGDVTLTPVQHRLQQQLLEKHHQLQEAILRQQEELQMISEQLSLAYTPSTTNSHQPHAGGTPLLLEPAIVTAAGLPLSSNTSLIPTAIPSNATALAPMMPIPVVLQPQQVVLGMPGGTLLTTSVTTPAINPTPVQQQPGPHKPSSN